MRRYLAEGIGAFAVVFTGCGAATLGAGRLGTAGVALAFGLALWAMTLALGPISGGWFNPAVTLAMAIAGRLPRRELLPCWAAQLAGGAAGAGAILATAQGKPGGAPLAAEAMANGFDRLSPGYYGLGAAALTEVALTAILALVVLGATEGAPGGGGAGPAPRRGQAPAAAAAGGAAYGLVHLVGMQVTGMSANPARSIGPALFAGGLALEQVWLFVAAPMAGAALAALAHKGLGAQGAARRPEAPHDK
ncbi:MAG: aquaporin [Polyangiaceae bacterium]|nr:aquaporin [Polyangiaceae bacterium]